MKPKRKFKSAIPPKIKVKWGKPPKLSCTIKIDDTPKHRTIFPKYIKNKPYPYAPPLVSMQPLPPPPQITINPLDSVFPNDNVWNTPGFWLTPQTQQQGPTGPTGPVGPVGYSGYYYECNGYFTGSAAVAAPVEEEYEEEEVQQIKYMINENVLYINSEDVLKRLNVDDEELYERFMEIMMEISNQAVDLGDSDPNKIKGN